MTEHVKTDVAAGIMTLTLTRADKKNALSNAMYSAMSDGLERGRAGPDHTRRAVPGRRGTALRPGTILRISAHKANGKDAGGSQAFRFIGNLAKQPFARRPQSKATR